MDLAPRLRSGVRYELLHRETRQVQGEPERRIRTRTVLEVVDAHGDGWRQVRARIFRAPDDDAVDSMTDELVTFDLSPTGEVMDPERQCGGIEELRVGRYLRHLFASRAFVANGVGQGSAWRARYLSDASELPAPAAFVLDRVGTRSALGRFRGDLRLEEGEVGEVRVTGRGRVRGRFTVALRDGFMGRTELATEIRGRIRTGRRERRGRVRIRSEVIVRRARSDLEAMSCEFDPEGVRRGLGARVSEIRACYEAALRENASLEGRVTMRFTIEVGGRVSAVEETENTLGSSLVSDCLGQVVRQLRVRPGPVGGPVTFDHPFVFAPAR